MELVSILQSSAIRFCTVENTGTIFGPDFVEAVRQRYRFWEFPKSPAEFRADDGIKFSHGLFNGTIINNITLYKTGVLAQGETDTSTLDLMIDDFLGWAEEYYSGKCILSTPVSRGYVSTIVVRAPTGVNGAFERLNRVSQALDGMLRGLGITAAPYSVSSFALQGDPAQSSPIVPGRFLFERRADTPLEERLFYTEAPVTTDQHQELLRHLDMAVRGS